MEKKELTKNETKEKIIKNCKVMEKTITGIMWTIAGLIIAYTAVIVILSIVFLVLPKDETNLNMVEQFIEVTDNIGSKINEVKENIEKFDEAKFNNPIVSILGSTMVIMILNNTIKVLRLIVEKETPFTEENIKNIKTISICATILWIISSESLIYVVTIWIMYFVFKYGYQLQIESDETL